MVKKKRRYNPNKAKLRHSYTFNEIAELFNVHVRTVQIWRKQGLNVIDEGNRPFLVIGEELRRFLRELRGKRKHPLQLDEFFCPKCKQPRKSQNNNIYPEITNKRIGRYKHIMLRGICEVCHSSLIRFSSDRLLDNLKEFNVILLEHQKLLTGNRDSSLNTDMQEVKNDTSK